MAENRLIHEKSPYLLQHAHDPVDWYPWGEAAFAAARRTDRPIFLSIGYSTCHWCHVMGRESFADTETAAALNRDFIAVKVDREERPDVDAVYMAACLALTGSGGWPLTILMTPEQRPFWAGTYLPRRSRAGQPGLMELLDQAAALWKADRTQLLRAGDMLTAHITQPQQTETATPDRALLHTAFAHFRRSFDAKDGGFSPPPKFPAAHKLLFLLEYGRLERQTEALHMAEITLTQMARGGLFDQIGGGFSRYSTDSRWLAPHFEKMLYDNALLAYAYLEAYVRTGGGFYRCVAERTLNYILRELTGPEGGFFCGQDADSEGVEGKYYLLTPREVAEVLGPEDGSRFCRWYDISNRGNFGGASIPNLLGNDDFTREPANLALLRERLYAYRLSRTRLHLDDKVLTAWNGLMVAALAKACRVLGTRRYLDAAVRAVSFLSGTLMRPDGRLLLRWRAGEAALDGQLDDYAFLAWALLELYAADGDVGRLRAAATLANAMEAHFSDGTDAGFFRTAGDAEALIARPKETYDGAMPSGNAVAGLALIRLWRLTGDLRWRERADRQLAFLAGSAAGHPAGHSFALLALAEALYPALTLVCAAADAPPPELQPLAERHRLHTLIKTRENAGELARLAPFTTGHPIPETGCTFYLCRETGCAAPVHNLGALEALL